MLHRFREKIGFNDLREVCGVRYEKHFCIGSKNGCVRNGEHKTHQWEEEILITDPIKIEGRMDAWIPLRSWNFLFMVWQIIQERRLNKITPQVIQDAIKKSKVEMFGIDGAPKNLSLQTGISYAQMLEKIEEDFKNIMS